MTREGYGTILIQDNSFWGVHRDEKIAAVAITPGELLESAATAGQVQPHGTAAGPVGSKMIALESLHIDYTAGTLGIDHDYPAGDTVYLAQAQQAEVYYMFLAGSQNVSEGDLLESDGAGALQAAGTAPAAHAVVAEAAEDLDNSTNGSRVRIRARIV